MLTVPVFPLLTQSSGCFVKQKHLYTQLCGHGPRSDSPMDSGNNIMVGLPKEREGHKVREKDMKILERPVMDHH